MNHIAKIEEKKMPLHVYVSIQNPAPPKNIMPLAVFQRPVCRSSMHFSE